MNITFFVSCTGSLHFEFERENIMLNVKFSILEGISHVFIFIFCYFALSS